jgi:hypothetical protein
MNNLQKAVLRTLAYYDVFRFPLKEDELIAFGGFDGHKEDLQRELRVLKQNGIIGELRGYYFLADFSPAHIEAREVNEIRAAAAAQKVKRYSNLIARFPFVDCVCISGSYSKGVLDRYGDVDYFIIAHPGRLWIARTMLVLFKKTFLFNSRRYFCINYLIDSQTLEIPDKNIFTATEVLTLLPMAGGEIYKQFAAQNQWAKSFLPNRNFSNTDCIKPVVRKGIFVKFLQYVLNGKIGDWLDNFCFTITQNRWEKKFPQLSSDEFELNLRSRKNVSKHHPRGFQFRVLSSYQQKLSQLMVDDKPVAVVA